MELISQLTDYHLYYFLLLFVRFSSVLAFFPFYDNQLFLVTIKAALAFYLTIIFYTITPQPPINFNIDTFLIAILSEALIGFMASILLQVVFAMLSYAGELISFVMGFTMASAFDPLTNENKPIISQVLIMTATLILLNSDMHHLILLFVDRSLDAVPLGGFIMSDNILDYILKSIAWLFLMGFTIAFPIVALILFSDIIFGMIMKTNPQFNILVIGFPIKIGLAFVVLIAILPAIMKVFKDEFMKAFNTLTVFLN